MKKTIGKLSLIVSLGLGAVVMANGCASKKSHCAAGKSIDDKTVETKVKSNLLSDPDVKGLAINVEACAGRIWLSGFVDTLAQKNRATELAREVPGVNSVKNDLAVK